jgi:hypothetical protein
VHVKWLVVLGYDAARCMPRPDRCTTEDEQIVLLSSLTPDCKLFMYATIGVMWIAEQRPVWVDDDSPLAIPCSGSVVRGSNPAA